MSPEDVTKLVERLRETSSPEQHEVRMKAWDHARKLIAGGNTGSLPRDIIESHFDGLEEDIRDALAALTAYEASASSLREALKPFASEADRIDPNGPDETINDNCEVWQVGGYPRNQSKITYGDLRRARASLSKGGKDGE